jgi:hypothetical protein
MNNKRKMKKKKKRKSFIIPQIGEYAILTPTVRSM